VTAPDALVQVDVYRRLAGLYNDSGAPLAWTLSMRGKGANLHASHNRTQLRTSLFARPLNKTLWAQTKPAPAPVRPVADTYFDKQVVDPYRWMEDLASPQMQAWLKEQGEYTRSTLARLPRRDEIAAAIRSDSESNPDHVQNVVVRGNRFFTLRRQKGSHAGKLFVRDGLSGTD